MSKQNKSPMPSGASKVEATLEFKASASLKKEIVEDLQKKDKSLQELLDDEETKDKE